MITAIAALALSSTFLSQEAPRIAILPTVNNSGEKWEDLRRRQAEKINNYLSIELGKRGFVIVPQDEVRNAIKKLNFDFSDEEQLKRANFFAVGKEVGATYVYFPLVMGTEQGYQDRDLFTDREGRTAIKAWLLNVPTESAILSAKVFNGRSGGMRITLKPSDRQVQAAANAVRDSLADFLKDFPVRK